MKTKYMILCLILFTAVNLHAQVKLKANKAQVKLKANNMEQYDEVHHMEAKDGIRASDVSMCKPMDTRRTETLLRDRVGKTLKMRLDRNEGYVEILRRKRRVAFTEFIYKKPGHDWKYFLQNVNSTEVKTSYSSKYYYLNVLFETEGVEIKGRCPGCLNRFEDSRAPDIQWKNPKIKIKLKPIAHKGSFTFEIADVEVEGKFEANGVIKAVLPSIVTYTKRQIRKAVESQIKQVLNSSHVKNMLADVFKKEVRDLGMSTVKMVDLTKSNIYLCQ